MARRYGPPVLLGGLSSAALPTCTPDRGSNRRPKSLRPAALPFGHYLHCRPSSSPLLTAESATDNKPKLCVSV